MLRSVEELAIQRYRVRVSEQQDIKNKDNNSKKIKQKSNREKVQQQQNTQH